MGGDRSVGDEGSNGHEQARVSYARCKRSSIKPGATPQVHSPQSIVALQAQKKCKPSAMSLLRWPRRSLFSIKVAKRKINGAMPVTIIALMGRNPVGSHPCIGNAYGYFCAYSAHCCAGTPPEALPQALYCCTFGARCLRRHHQHAHNDCVSSRGHRGKRKDRSLRF